jgi:hypothetical protein
MPNRHMHSGRGVAVIAMLLMAALPARAQLPGALNGLTGGLPGGVPSVSQADPANIAGLLQYCVQNNYLSSATAGAAQSGLLAKIPGVQQSSDYAAGSSGLLQTGNGKSFDLGSVTGDLKSQVAKKVCDEVLKHAQSLL